MDFEKYNVMIWLTWISNDAIPFQSYSNCSFGNDSVWFKSYLWRRIPVWQMTSMVEGELSLYALPSENNL